jgi:hypothetical protein
MEDLMVKFYLRNQDATRDATVFVIPVADLENITIGGLNYEKAERELMYRLRQHLTRAHLEGTIRLKDNR